VIGPESSGTRLLTRILISAGAEGDDTHEQRFDIPGLLAATRPEIIAWRRSLPHAFEWVDVQKWVGELADIGYDAEVLFTSRDWYATIRSQLAVGHVEREEQALDNLRRAYAVLAQVPVPFRVVSYEALRDSRAVTALLKALGLSERSSVTVRDENEKWLSGIAE
jgi:hypothetical protein